MISVLSVNIASEVCARWRLFYTSKRIFLRLICSLSLIFCATATNAADIAVAAGQKIQPAIDRAVAGDRIVIAYGLYPENLIIDKPITLTSNGRRPTISGGQRDHTIRVDVADVVIEKLIIRDSGDSLLKQNAGIYFMPSAHRGVVRYCDLTYNLFGLWIEKANDATVTHNRITGKRNYRSAMRGNGIQLYNTTGAIIEHNDISFVRDAIYVDVSHRARFVGNKLHHSRYGTHYMNSWHNLWEDNDSYYNRGGLALMEVRFQTVRNNRAWGNSDHGIMLRTIQNAEVTGNIVAGNHRGFFIYDAEDNILRDNLIVDNRMGVHLWAGSIKNEVEGNDFISNRDQVRYVASKDIAWGEKTGNYWSNYSGWDRDGNGRGDIPYEANDMVDRLTWQFPLMKLLMASPAVQTLRFVSQQFPMLRAPSIVDAAPRMQPTHQEWRGWMGRYFENRL
ncbi:Putative copper binding periplasmic protein [gamma proteobacterium HdN1]|nr:Putative copper binding periplasmic protein [gamma proteobacterium HdN1]